MRKSGITRALKGGLIFLIQLYQHTFSTLLGPCCRFTPSCSSYAFLSIERFGIMEGTWLTLKRLVKCHPLHPGGYDPVPENPKIHSHPACPEPARFGACRLPALYQDGSGPAGRQGRQE